MEEKKWPSAYELREKQKEDIMTEQLDDVFEEIKEAIRDDEDTRELYYHDELCPEAIEKLEELGYFVEQRQMYDPMTDTYDEYNLYYYISWEER